MTWQPTSRYVEKESSVTCRRCGAVGSPLAEFVSPYTGLCVGCSTRPIPAPTPKRYVITLEEMGVTDCPRNGQPFIGFGGLPQYAIGDWKDEKRPLLRVVSREAK